MLTSLAFLLLSAAPPAEAVDRAMQHVYNFDFRGAYAILDEHDRATPGDPLGYAIRGAAHLFEEFERLGILEMEFFADDETVTDKQRLRPAPTARAHLFAATGEARKLAKVRLARDDSDREALFALNMAAGVETEYTLLVEKKYLRGYSLSKESQSYARRLVAMNPPVWDAYLTLGSVEYIVANLNPFFRWFVRFEQIQGSRQRAQENLEKVVAGGRFYPPFAKAMLAVMHLRERRPAIALKLLQELEGDFPANSVYRAQASRVARIVARGTE